MENLTVLDRLQKCFESCVVSGDGEKAGSFAEIAAKQLGELELSSSDTANLWEEIVLRKSFPKQNFSLNQFGYPSFTLFRSGNFAMDLYAWPITNLSTHSHDFEGAFKVLGPEVWQVLFDFKKEREIVPGIALGSLDVKENKALRRSDVCAIYEYDEFIHFIRHQGKKGLSLVVRTVQNPGCSERKKTLAEYFYPGLELEVDRSLELVLEKKFEIFRYSLSDMKLNFFLKSLTDYEIFTVLLRSIGDLEDSAFLAKLREEVGARKHGSEILDSAKKHMTFMKKVNILYPRHRDFSLEKS